MAVLLFERRLATGQVTLGLLKDLVRLETTHFMFTVYTGMLNVFTVVMFDDTALAYWL